MIRKIVRVGNSYGVIIPKSVLKLFDWDVRELEAEIDTNKKELIIRRRKGLRNRLF